MNSTVDSSDPSSDDATDVILNYYDRNGALIQSNPSNSRFSSTRLKLLNSSPPYTSHNLSNNSPASSLHGLGMTRKSLRDLKLEIEDSPTDRFRTNRIDDRYPLRSSRFHKEHVASDQMSPEPSPTISQGLPDSTTRPSRVRPKSEVWNDLDAVRERIRLLKMDRNGTDASTPISSQNSFPRLSTASDRPSPLSYHRRSNTISSRRVVSSPMNTDLPSRSYVPSYIQSSPIIERAPSRAHSRAGWSGAPLRSAAERRLTRLIETIRQVNDHDMILVLLERAASDLVALYRDNFADTDSLERACTSLSDYIEQVLEHMPNSRSLNGSLHSQNEQSSASTPSELDERRTPFQRFGLARRTQSTVMEGSDLSRFDQRY